MNLIEALITQAPSLELQRSAHAEICRLRAEVDAAVRLLAEWCVAVDVNGAGWDYWDEHYKDAMYRPGPLRDMLDAAIARERELRGVE